MNVAWSHSTLVLAAQNVTDRTHLWNFICTSIIFSTSKNPVNIMLHWLFIIMYVCLFLNFFGYDFTVFCAIRPWMWGLFWEMVWWDVEGGVHYSCKDFFLLLFDWTGGNHKGHLLRISAFWPKNQTLTILVMNQKCLLLTYSIFDAKCLWGFDEILMSITQQFVSLWYLRVSCREDLNWLDSL